jgi:methylated-DNA-protein-cysteine methyltransferase related protein
MRGLSEARGRRPGPTAWARTRTKIGRAVTWHTSDPYRERAEASASAAVRRKETRASIDEFAGRYTRTAHRPRSAAIFRRVYAFVRTVPRGRVVSYGMVARALGMPRGARTVGWALSACPRDVPWHRVVNAQGKISWRPSGGHDKQRALLRREGVRFDRQGRIDLERFGWRRV